MRFKAEWEKDLENVMVLDVSSLMASSVESVIKQQQPREIKIESSLDFNPDDYE